MRVLPIVASANYVPHTDGRGRIVLGGQPLKNSDLILPLRALI